MVAERTWSACSVTPITFIYQYIVRGGSNGFFRLVVGSSFGDVRLLVNIFPL